jgi:hypothetical protein
MKSSIFLLLANGKNLEIAADEEKRNNSNCRTYISYQK